MKELFFFLPNTISNTYEKMQMHIHSVNGVITLRAKNVPLLDIQTI